MQTHLTEIADAAAGALDSLAYVGGLFGAGLAVLILAEEIRRKLRMRRFARHGRLR